MTLHRFVLYCPGWSKNAFHTVETVVHALQTDLMDVVGDNFEAEFYDRGGGYLFMHVLCDSVALSFPKAIGDGLIEVTKVRAQQMPIFPADLVLRAKDGFYID